MARSKILFSSVATVIGKFDPKELPDSCRVIGNLYFELADKICGLSNDHPQIVTVLNKLFDVRQLTISLACPETPEEAAEKEFHKHLYGQ